MKIVRGAGTPGTSADQYSSVTIYVDEFNRAAQEDQLLGLQMQNALEDSWETFTENAEGDAGQYLSNT